VARDREQHRARRRHRAPGPDDRIEVRHERPQERTGFKYAPWLAATRKAHRSELLTAALTILRAYHVAGRPEHSLPSWGSFPAWSRLIREALVWTGAADPFITQQRATSELNEPENDAHDFWLSVVAKTDGTPAAVAAMANQDDARTVLGLRDELTPMRLKQFVGRFVDRPRSGQRLRKVAGRYRVEPIF
jgi:putative DNA primase/helicase